MPTVEEIETVWDLPDRPTEPVPGGNGPDYEEALANYQRDLAWYMKKEQLLTWYASEYISMTVGETWGNTQKCTKLMTDKVMLQDDPSGKEKVLVSVTSEAFGQLIYKNCRTKWIAVWKYKKQHGAKAPLPKYSKTDTSTHQYEGLWSNARTGQVEGGGWHMDGLQYLMDRMEAISAIRAEDQASDYVTMKHVRTLIQGAMEWQPTANKKRSTAQAKNAAVEGAVVSKKIKMLILDE